MVELRFVFLPSSPGLLLSDWVSFCLLLLSSRIHIYHFFSCGSFNWTTTGDIDLRDCPIDMEALEAEQTNSKRKLERSQAAGLHGCHFTGP